MFVELSNGCAEIEFFLVHNVRYFLYLRASRITLMATHL